MVARNNGRDGRRRVSLSTRQPRLSLVIGRLRRYCGLQSIQCTRRPNTPPTRRSFNIGYSEKESRLFCTTFSGSLLALYKAEIVDMPQVCLLFATAHRGHSSWRAKVLPVTLIRPTTPWRLANLLCQSLR